MELSENIKILIAKQINKNRFVEILPEDIRFEDFIMVAKDYLNKFGYIPESWKPYISKKEYIKN